VTDKQLEERVLRLEQELLRLRRSHAGLEVGAGLNRLGQDTEIAGEIEAESVGAALLAAIGAGLLGAWTSYSDTSTIVGWGSHSAKQIYYKKIGKLVFVKFYLSGVSDSTTVTFTLPHSVASNPVTQFLCRVYDNSAGRADPGYGVISGNTVTIYKSLASFSADFTASGNKFVIGQFFYESA
jgi:hypothetical protein